MKIIVALVLAYCLFSPAVADESVWTCHFPNAPAAFPKSLLLIPDEGRLLEHGHLPYQIVQDSALGLVAVSSFVGTHVGRPDQVTGRYIENDLGHLSRWTSPVIWAEVLEINRQTGAALFRVVRMDRGPSKTIRGICRLRP